MGRLIRGALWIAVAAGIGFALGAVVGADLPPSTADWLSFAGALIGAAVTVAGSVYILDRERGREERDRRELLLLLLDEAANACVPFQVANEKALKERYGKSALQQAREVQGAIKRIREIGNGLKPTSIQMMKVRDAIKELPAENPELIGEATAAGHYPESGDFGHLNSMAHEIQSKAAKVRALLRV